MEIKGDKRPKTVEEVLDEHFAKRKALESVEIKKKREDTIEFWHNMGIKEVII